MSADDATKTSQLPVDSDPEPFSIVEIIENGVRKRTTAQQIANLFVAPPLSGVLHPSIRGVRDDIRALTLIDGQSYTITDPPSPLVELTLIAQNDGQNINNIVLNPLGRGVTNSGYPCVAGYNINDNFIYEMHVPHYNQHAYRKSGSTSNAIENIIWGSPQWANIEIVESTLNNVSSGTITNQRLNGVIIDFYGSNSQISGVDIGFGARIDLGFTNFCQYNGGKIGGGARVSLAEECIFDNCVVGEGKELICLIKSYSPSNKIYDGNISTFVVSAEEHASVNPNVLGVIDMAEFSWAGILRPNSEAFALNAFSAFPSDHKVVIFVETKNLVVNDKSVDSGNIQLEVASSITLERAKGHFLEFQKSFVSEDIVKIGGAQPISEIS